MADDPSRESRTGPTPNGGVRSVAYYFDGARRRTTKDRATSVEIVEYDARDRVVGRTYLERARKS
jgi:hypothetical protein